jgi:hypothetical protein
MAGHRYGLRLAFSQVLFAVATNALRLAFALVLIAVATTLNVLWWGGLGATVLTLVALFPFVLVILFHRPATRSARRPE